MSDAAQRWGWRGIKLVTLLVYLFMFAPILVVVVLVVVVLGAIGYSLAGAFGRLSRELAGAERDVRPVLDQARATAAAAQARNPD